MQETFMAVPPATSSTTPTVPYQCGPTDSTKSPVSLSRNTYMRPTIFVREHKAFIVNDDMNTRYAHIGSSRGHGGVDVFDAANDRPPL